MFLYEQADCVRDADASQSHLATANRVLVAGPTGAAQRKNGTKFGQETAEAMDNLSLASRSESSN